jgi:single-stranded DNA-binding protein
MEAIVQNNLIKPKFVLPEESMKSTKEDQTPNPKDKTIPRMDEIFFGRLGKDPKMHYTNNKPVCTLSVAVNTSGKEKADWKRVIVWGKDAKSIMKDMKKGSGIFVKGHQKMRDFIGNDNESRSITEVMAHAIGTPVT